MDDELLVIPYRDQEQPRRLVRRFRNFNRDAATPGWFQRFPNYNDPWWAANSWPTPARVLQLQETSGSIAAIGADTRSSTVSGSPAYQRTAGGIYTPSRTWDRKAIAVDSYGDKHTFGGNQLFDTAGAFAVVMLLRVSNKAGTSRQYSWILDATNLSGTTGFVCYYDSASDSLVSYLLSPFQQTYHTQLDRDCYTLTVVGVDELNRSVLGQRGSSAYLSRSPASSSISGTYDQLFTALGVATVYNPFDVAYAAVFEGAAASNVFDNWTARSLAFWTAADPGDLECSRAAVAQVPASYTAAWSAPQNAALVQRDGLLIHPAFSNLLLQSEMYETSWTQTYLTASDCSAYGPDGLRRASTVTESADDHQHDLTQSVALTAGMARLSCYAKANGRRYLQVSLTNDAIGYTSCIGSHFDLTLGTVADDFTGSGGDAEIVSLGDGWYLCSITVAIGATTNWTANLGLRSAAAHKNDSATADHYLGDGASGALLAGAWLMEGDWRSPYAVTTTAAASSPASAIYLTSAELLQALSTPGRAKLVIDFRIKSVVAGNYYLCTLYKDGTHWAEIGLFYTGGYYYLGVVTNAGNWTGTTPIPGAYIDTTKLYRGYITLWPDGTLRLAFSDPAIGGTQLVEAGSVAWTGVSGLTRLYLGCDHSGTGQQPIVFDRVEAIP